MNLKSFYIFIIASFLLSAVLSCQEEVISTENPVPNIQFVSVSSNQLKQFSDSLVVTLKYKDGDGDLGDISADSFSISVRDFRLTKPDYLHLIPLSPIGNKISIEGVLNLKIKNIFLLSSAPSEITKFEIKIKDRSKNWSNTILTPNIEIIR